MTGGRTLPFDQWPATDQAAWVRATARRDSPFRRHGGGRTLSPSTVRSTAAGNGRWLGYLDSIGELDPSVPPDQRATADRLDAYFQHLRDCGNADTTVVNRFVQLRAALQLLVPDQDHRWITRPRGISLRQMLPMKRRDRPLHLTNELLDWARATFRAGLAHHKPRCRRALVRDGAMMGILAMPAPRLRALTSLELGRHLQRRDDGWFLDLDASVMKTGAAQGCPLLPEASAMLDRYIEVERNEMLNGTAHERLWISRHGTPLSEAGIVGQLRNGSLRRFGHRVGPHAFRHGLGSTAALEGYASPLDGSILLGHADPQTTIDYYNRAKATAASLRHSERLRRLRG